MNEPPTTEEGLRELQRRNHEILKETFRSQSERIKEQNERIREEIQQLQSAREGLRSVAPFTYEPTTELPKVEWGHIADPVELALAKILSPPDLKELLPDPIALSERLPGLEDCHCITRSTARDGAYIWAGTVIQSAGLNSFWSWELVGRDFAIANSALSRGPAIYTHWLPAHVRYLPGRVGL
jgi:hypothetical protein